MAPGTPPRWFVLLLISGLATGLGAATPDSGPAAVDPQPLRERARLLDAMGVSKWHKFGHTGKGVKVAILDSGFRGYRVHLGKALPGEVTTRSFRTDSDLEAKDSQHGILCAEAIHAVAPDAELLLANWEPDQPARFLDAVRWAKEQGAQVVSCSLIMPSWSDGEGNGAAHESLHELLKDLLCFASAGNTAQRHWRGPFKDGDGWHVWPDGSTFNTVRPWGDERVSVEACWSGGAEYEVVVFDTTTLREVARGRRAAGLKHGCASARFDPVVGHDYAVRLHLAGGKAERFHVVALGGGLDQATRDGSLPFPADGRDVLAVGAVDEDGRRLAYSSCGPNSSCAKPDLVAAIPFPSAWRARPFAGTSAAAPQAAGLAALVWSRHPAWSASKVRGFLLGAARDLGPAGHDHETGHGRITLP